MTGIALLGAGLFAKEAHLPALIEHNASLLAVYSRSSATAKSFVDAAAEQGLRNSESITVYSDDDPTQTLAALLARADIQAVIIALPIAIQPTVVQQCIAAGKHVLCEKPLAPDTQSASDLIAKYESLPAATRPLFAIAEQIRHDRAVVRAKTLVKDIGAVEHVHVRVWSNIDPVHSPNRFFETSWRKQPTHPAGFILDGGVHFIALLRYVSGLEVVETASLNAQIREWLPPVDTVNAAVKMDNGAAGSVSISFSSKRPTFEFIFVGEKGTVVLSAAGEGTSRVVLEGEKGVVSEEVIEGKGVSEEVKAFLEGVDKGVLDERLSARQAFADLAVIESIVQGGGVVATI